MKNSILYVVYLSLIVLVMGCATNRYPVNKTYSQKVTPSQELALAYAKQMKQADRIARNPEAMFRKQERKRSLNKSNMAFKKLLKRVSPQSIRRRMLERSYPDWFSH